MACDIRARQQFPLAVRTAVDIEADPAALMLVGQRHVVPVVIIDPAPRRDLADPANVEDELPLADEQALPPRAHFLVAGPSCEEGSPLLGLDPGGDRVVGRQLEVLGLGDLDPVAPSKSTPVPGGVARAPSELAEDDDLAGATAPRRCAAEAAQPASERPATPALGHGAELERPVKIGIAPEDFEPRCFEDGRLPTVYDRMTRLPL